MLLKHLTSSVFRYRGLGFATPYILYRKVARVRQAVQLPARPEAIYEIAVAEKMRQSIIVGELDSGEIKEKLHILHNIIIEEQQPKTRSHLRMRRWGTRGRGTKWAAGARINVVRERHITAMSPEEFKSPEDRHPHRKVCKTKYKAALLVKGLQDFKATGSQLNAMSA